MTKNKTKKKVRLAKVEKDKGQEGIFFEPIKFDEQEIKRGLVRERTGK